ncbi:MAG: flavin monoamine oxidase family protein, partial [Gaiellales bacterium]
MKPDVDVVIVGGGFAGVTAARELNRHGLRKVILEARDRLGGRTWIDRRLGLDLELGGTWVHWIQPHVWAEISRYGLGVVSSPTAERAVWLVEGTRDEGAPAELFGILEEGSAPAVADSATVFPRPYEPMAEAERVRDLDGVTMADRFAATEMKSAVRPLTEALWSLHFHCRLDQGALTQGLRWVALAAWSSELLDTACATYKVAGGTRALLEAMLADARQTEIRTGADVAALTQAEGVVAAHLSSGGQVTGRAAVVTVPRNVLSRIRFTPALSPAKQAAADEGQPSCGTKVWIRVRGHLDPVVLMADVTHPLVWVQSEHWIDGDSVLVGFGIDSHALDVSDRGAVEQTLRAWLPDAEVAAVAGHDWVEDELSRGTWPMLRPGQLSRLHAGTVEPDGRLFLAGSDYASGWAGFIDGAIE